MNVVFYVIRSLDTGKYFYSPKRWVSGSFKWVDKIEKARKFSKLGYANRSISEMNRYEKRIINVEVVEYSGTLQQLNKD